MLPSIARCIAFYVPGYYPFPENDRWWGTGFTEWNLVKQTKPLFAGHLQPRVPDSILGYYDPRQPGVRRRQAQLAMDHGIEAFCYWHMWFGERKMLLHEPIDDVLATGVPEMPYCLAWANQTWTRRWARFATQGETLIRQTYPGVEDHCAHFQYLLPHFRNPQYLKVAGKPVFVIYQPFAIPDRDSVIKLWRKLAMENGLAGLFIVGITRRHPTAVELRCLDGYTRNQPSETLLRYASGAVRSMWAIQMHSIARFAHGVLRKPQVFLETDITRFGDLAGLQDSEFPQVLTNWDDTPRQGPHGTVIHGTESKVLRHNLDGAVRSVRHRPFERRLVFLKSWNEWGEGNYVEPDNVHGMAPLRAIRDIVSAA